MAERDAITGAYSPAEVLDALHWCRLGRVRPQRDGAFHEARAMGLLAQDPVWRTTVAGEVRLASERPEAYGRRPMAIECPHCGAAPYEPCEGRLSGKYQLTHAKRARQADAPAPDWRPIEREGTSAS